MSETFVPRIKCACGFEVETENDDTLTDLYSEHRCPSVPPRPQPSVWAYVFSFPTVIIVFFVGLTILYIVHPELFPRR